MAQSRRKSVMAHQFSQVPKAQIPRSSFDRSHGLKTTFDAGFLVPIYVDEVLPGDTFNLRMTAFSRMATPIHPLMDNLHMETFFFFTPNRLIWDQWQKFNGEQDNPGDSIDFLVPQITVNNVADSSLWDYLGFPVGKNVTANALHSRAYNLIWNEWFRDQNLQPATTVDKGNGPDTDTNYKLLRRGKRHDYFTSSLPWPQKGDPVTLPLQATAPVAATEDFSAETTMVFGSVPSPGGPQRMGVAVSGSNRLAWDNATTPGAVNVVADLTQASATTINALRQAFQIQKMQERDARGGTRYTEIIRSHFGVISPDARLQRPEFLGGGRSYININPVAQTSETQSSGGATPQGNLSAFATASLDNHGFTRSFTEHGVIIGLVNVRADLTYQQGLNRMYSRRTRYDYFWPALSHLGEQAVLNKEIFLDNTAEDEAVWGYQERSAEYRYKPSQITGKFRSAATGSLDPWHLSGNFGARPTLSDQFIQDNPPIARVLAVQNEPQFLFDAHFSLRCARPMPLYGVPGMIDHF